MGRSLQTLNFKINKIWSFVLLKRCFRLTDDVSCLEDTKKVVAESTQLVGTEDGTVLVPTYNWQEFVNPAYRQLLGIKPMGHFGFSADHPGMVFYRTTIAGAEEVKQLAISSSK